MFVVTLNKTSLKKVGAGALCCALVIFSAFLGRYISTRTVAAAAGVNRIESAQDIQTWFTGYGLDVDGTSITADKVKIPRKWDDSFSAFNGVVQQSGMDLTRYKGKTVEKWTALIPAASSGETSRYGVLLVYRKKAVGAYLLEKPSGTVIGLKDAQAAMAQAEQQDAQQTHRHRQQYVQYQQEHARLAHRLVFLVVIIFVVVFVVVLFLDHDGRGIVLIALRGGFRLLGLRRLCRLGRSGLLSGVGSELLPIRRNGEIRDKRVHLVHGLIRGRLCRLGGRFGLCFGHGCGRFLCRCFRLRFRGRGGRLRRGCEEIVLKH